MTKGYVLSTAKKGHVTQCIAVAELLGIEIIDVLEERGVNKEYSDLRREMAKVGWLFAALRMAWKFRNGRFVILSSGRSVLPSCWLLKMLRGDNLFLIHIGSPKKWKKRCVDVMLRAEHEREAGRDEDHRYPWNPKQVWIDAPICRPLPVGAPNQKGVAVLVGGLNITYGDNVDAYTTFLDDLEKLVPVAPVSIVFSRRTKPAVKRAFQERFAGTSAVLINAEDQQGFLHACETAGAFVVTPDSITMIAEATATGKPVYVGRLPEKRKGTRNHRFVGTAFKNGHIAEFVGVVDFERRVTDLSYIERARQELDNHIQTWLNTPKAKRAELTDRATLD